MSPHKISIIVDNPDSWMVPYAQKFTEELKKKGNTATYCKDHASVPNGEIAVFLSCERKIERKTMDKNTHNLVVHESDLPDGKGWSPVSWQILEGKNQIPICLFEATDSIDAGPIYFKDQIKLDGYELIEEIREKQAKKTFELVLHFIEKFPKLEKMEQSGTGSHYRKRVPEDSRLDPSKSLLDQFNLLRIVDNEKYPAFFEHMGHKYMIKIYKGGKLK